MTKRLFFIGIITLLFGAFSSCIKEEVPKTKVKVEKEEYIMPYQGTLDVLFKVDPQNADATKAIIGINHYPILKTDDPDIKQLIPSMVTVKKSFVSNDAWVATIKLVDIDGKDFVPQLKYSYSLTGSACIIINDGSRSQFFKITYEHKANEAE